MTLIFGGQNVVQQAKSALENPSLTGVPQMRNDAGAENMPPNAGFDMGQVGNACLFHFCLSSCLHTTPSNGKCRSIDMVDLVAAPCRLVLEQPGEYYGICQDQGLILALSMGKTHY